jgi:hypothetical protein
LACATAKRRRQPPSSHDPVAAAWRPAALAEYQIGRQLDEVAFLPGEEKERALGDVELLAESLEARLEALPVDPVLANCHDEAVRGARELRAAFADIRASWRVDSTSSDGGPPGDSAEHLVDRLCEAMSTVWRGRRGCGVPAATPDGLDPDPCPRG